MKEKKNYRLLIFSAFLLIAAFFVNVKAQTIQQKDPTVSKNENVAKDDKITNSATTKPSEETLGGVKVTFDEKNPNIMIVESNGEKFRVDSTQKTVEKIFETTNAKAENSPVTITKPTQQTDDKKKNKAKKDEADDEDMYAYESGDEPFDYKLINVPTPKKVPKGTWNLNFSHRFSQPINPVNESGKMLLGFDSMSASSFGVMYGITDKFYVSASRSPICMKGLCRTIEVGFGYHVTDQNKKSPVAFSLYGSVEGNENFTQEYTYNLQTMISRDFGKRFFLFFSPAVHINTNGQRRFNPRPEDYYPPATVADTFKLPAHSASFGFGAAFRLRYNLSALFEFTPRIGFKMGKVDPIFNSNFDVVGFKNISQPAIGFGLAYTKGKHSFTFTLSNTQTTTTSKYNSSNLVLSPKNLIVGFNLFRRW